MADFDAAAAEQAATSVSPDSPPAAGTEVAGISSPAGSSSASAPPVAAPPPEKVSRPVAASHFTEEVAVDLIDKSLYSVLKRKARRLGLRLNLQDRQALKLSETERDELLMSVGGVMPYIAQYADLLGKVSLALFGFALWSIYSEKSDMLELAAQIAANQAKGGPGFAAARPAGNGFPIIPPAGPLKIPTAPAIPDGFDPDRVKGIPVHEPKQ